jgi:glycosyltransferase involved in cell wall biosynthesis
MSATADPGPITALLPVKNHHPEHLRASIGSMLAQTSPEWRLLIIVEPEDVDRFRSLLAAALEDPRIRIIANEGHRHAGAFNTGMREAGTDFVAILLSDDMWEPHAVETLRANIGAHPEVDLFHSGRRIVDSDGQPISSVHQPQDTVSLEEFIWRSPVKHLICWRRAFGLRIGGMDERIATAGPDDYDFPWTMLERGATIRAIHECLYVYRDHRDAFRNTTHIPRSVHLRMLRYILRKHGVRGALIRKKLRHAKRHYLRQCLYRNQLDKRIKLFFGFKASRGWRETYQ